MEPRKLPSWMSGPLRECSLRKFWWLNKTITNYIKKWLLLYVLCFIAYIKALITSTLHPKKDHDQRYKLIKMKETQNKEGPNFHFAWFDFRYLQSSVALRLASSIFYVNFQINI